MNEQTGFVEFPKMARLSRECIITEKIDGTNAQIFICKRSDANPNDLELGSFPFMCVDDWLITAGSRNRWISAKNDNYGFGKWVSANREELIKLGSGRHFGEWWGGGIQRGYGLAGNDKRFSLFNVTRWCLHDEVPKFIHSGKPQVEWSVQDVLPACVGLVPVVGQGLFSTDYAQKTLEWLRDHGSLAAPGFMKPEGIVVWHTAANIGFKKTIEKDEMPKSKV